MTRAIGVEVDCPFTPGALRKVVYAGSLNSFAGASGDLLALAEMKVSEGKVERWSKRVGNERVAEVEAAAESYQHLPLPQQRESPRDQIPQVAHTSYLLPGAKFVIVCSRAVR